MNKSQKTTENLRLSNYEFRAYRKKTGFLSLHLKSHLLIKTRTPFHLATYLASMVGQLVLPNQTPIDLDSLAFVDWVAFKYDGSTLVHEFWIAHVSTWRTLPRCLGQLRLSYRLNLPWGVFAGSHQHDAIIVRRFPDTVRVTA